MDEQYCPRCKTTKYRNPNLKLLVNVCGHTLCENCVELLFVRGSGACQECGVALRRSNFRAQVFEDAYVEKEVDIRRKVLRDFNKKEEDFATLRDYNDYLEEIETIVFNLANKIDVDETKRRIEMYKKENQAAIKKNRTKLSREEEELNHLIEIEKEELEHNRHIAQEEQKQKLLEKKKQRDTLIDNLMFSDMSAEKILAAHREELLQKQQEEESSQPKRATQFSTGIKVGGTKDILSARTSQTGVMFKYTPTELVSYGPVRDIMPEQLLAAGYLNHMRKETETEKGGGFLSHIACQRALQEAMCGLFFTFDCVQEQLAESQEVAMITSS